MKLFAKKRWQSRTDIPPEYAVDPNKEITAPPDEYDLNAPIVEREERKPSTVRKIMLYLASIGIVILGVITPIVHVNTAEETAAAETVPPVVEVTPTAVPASTPTLVPTPNITPTPVPTAEPTPIAVPRYTGLIHIVVYSDIYSREMAMQDRYPSTILAEETLDAATFEEYALPALPELAGYTAQGYVLLADSSRAYLESLCFENEKPHPIGSIPLGSSLRADDLGILPKSIEGVYEAEIHVVWFGDFRLEFYDGELLFGECAVGFPIESEGLFYLAPFPVPQRAGKTFAGWCDVDGNMIDAVTYYDFFEKLPDAKTPEDRDWTKRITCRVYACWSDGSGGAPPTPVPTPKPTPRPTPVPPQHTFTCSSRCGFSKGSFGGSKTVYEGQRVTIYASAEGWSGAGIFQTGTGDMISVSPYTHDGDVYWYRYTFTVGDRDLKVSFMY